MSKKVDYRFVGGPLHARLVRVGDDGELYIYHDFDGKAHYYNKRRVSWRKGFVEAYIYDEVYGMSEMPALMREVF